MTCLWSCVSTEYEVACVYLGMFYAFIIWHHITEGLFRNVNICLGTSSGFSSLLALFVNSVCEETDISLHAPRFMQ